MAVQDASDPAHFHGPVSRTSCSESPGLDRSESERQGYTDQMSQELIGIIGAATVAVALATPVHAQVDCADWNTAAFFEAAEVSDVTRCLREGAVPVARDSLGNTPLHSAAPWGTAETVTALLEAGADLEARNGIGSTPLHVAALTGTAEVLTALLEAGADPNARDSNGKLPFDYARDNDQLKGTDAYWKLNDARFQ